MTTSPWSITKKERPHGGLFELEITTTWRVLHDSTPIPIYLFSDTEEATYGDGGRWNTTHPATLLKLTIEPHPKPRLAVHSTDEPIKYFPLYAPNAPACLDEVTSNDFTKLLQALHKARDEYLHMEAWSSDVSIPPSAIREGKEAVEMSWKAIEVWIRNLGLSQHASTIEVVGKSTAEPPIIGFFAQQHHQLESWSELPR